MLLTCYGNVPAERAANLIGMLLGVPVSAGFVDGASERLASRLDGAGFDEAMQAALAAEPAVTGAVNIASGRPRTVLELATALAAAAGRPDLAPVVTGQWRLGDVRHVTASADRAATELGFVAEVPFATGMAELAATPA